MVSIFRTLGARHASEQHNERDFAAHAGSAINNPDGLENRTMLADEVPATEVDIVNADTGMLGHTRALDAREVIRELERVASARKEGNPRDADFSDCEIIGFDFSEYVESLDKADVLTGANFKGATIIGCRFGPKISGLRAQDRISVISPWMVKGSCNLEGANFGNTAIFWSLFTGVRLSNATFDKAEIYHSSFDLAYLSDKYAWGGVNFCQARIEKTTFRGVRINADFSLSRIFYCDFTPAFLPPGDWKNNPDPRLTSAIQIQLNYSTSDFRTLLRGKRTEIKEMESEGRLATDDLAVSKLVIETLEKHINDFSFLLRNMMPARLSGSNFEDALLYECEFRSARLTPLVNFDTAKIFKSDFTPARVEDIPVRLMIENQLHEHLNSSDSSELSQVSIPRQLRLVDRLIRQVADDLEDLDSTNLHAVISDEEFDSAIIPTKLATASFEEAVISETRLTYADLQMSEFGDAIITDVSAEYANFSDCNLQQSVFYKTNGDGSKFDNSNCTRARFDGNLGDGEKTQKIESFARFTAENREAEKERFERREKEISKLRKTIRNLRRDLGLYDQDDTPTNEDTDYGVNEPSISDSDAARIVFNSTVSVKKKRDLFKLYRLERLYRRNAYTSLAAYFSELENEIDEDYAGAERAGEQAGHSAQNSCSFIGGSFAGIKTDRGGVSFKFCSLEAANFENASLGSHGGGLGANFDLAFLRAANFSDADLERASFSGATLTGVSGLGSAISLEGASFLGTQGLMGKEFSEADLSNAILPEDLKRFGGVLASVEQLTRQARILFATLMFACAYSIMAVVNLNGSSISSEITFKLPVLGVAVSKSIFYLVTPPLIFSFFVMFHLKFSRIWLEAKSLPRKFPDGRGVDRHLFPWIFASLVPMQLGSNRGEPSKKGRQQQANNKKKERSSGVSEEITQQFERGLAYVFGWWVAPLTILFFVWQQNIEFSKSNSMISVFGHDYATNTILFGAKVILFGALVILITETVQLSGLLSRLPSKKISEGRQGDKGKSFSNFIRRFIAILTERLRSVIDRFARIFGVAAVTIGILTMGAIFSLGPKGFQEIAISAPKAFGDDVGALISTSAVKLGRALYEVDAMEFKTLSLQGNDFSRADIAFLALANVDLRGEDFSKASLFNAQFVTLDLQNANFREANMTRADFGGSNLEGANFDGTVLSGANLSKVENLMPEQLSTACGDAHTRLPSEMAPLKLCHP